MLPVENSTPKVSYASKGEWTPASPKVCGGLHLPTLVTMVLRQILPLLLMGTNPDLKHLDDDDDDDYIRIVEKQTFTDKRIQYMY